MNTSVSTDALAIAPTCTDVLPPGSKAGPWLIEHELGRGGMGAVYAVVHEDIGKRAALKLIHRHLFAASSVERMLVEARVVNLVGHPNIVDIFETGTLADGRPYIVMERLAGQSLGQRTRLGKILPDTVIEILGQVCDALVAAHGAGIIHRDLKTDNVFLVEAGPGVTRTKLLDWGIAKEMTPHVQRTTQGMVVGTPHYLAPEQARGAAVTVKTDVYSLGVMAYELFLEQLPFEAETSVEIMTMHLRSAPPLPRDIWPEIPNVLEALLLAMLAKDPEQRPSMNEVIRRLEAVRVEIERRKAAAVVARPHPPTTNRAALAPTALAPSVPRRAWRYAVGAAAFAAIAAMFVITSESDSAARSNETAAASTIGVATPVSHPAASSRSASTVSPVSALRAVPAVATPPAPVVAVRAAPSVHAPVPALAPPPHRVSPRAIAPHPARKAPPPHRASRIHDPDGTIDAYPTSP